MQHKAVQIAENEYGTSILTETGYVLRFSFGTLKVQFTPEDIDKVIEIDRLSTQPQDNLTPPQSHGDLTHS